MSLSRNCTLLGAALALMTAPARAQERAYFVTYDHYLEEPRNLEIAVAGSAGFPRRGRGYAAPWLELEYGVTGRWTTELYVEGVTTRREGSAFTGWRWENRFRLMQGEHRVNPVLYVEYESINEASRIQKAVVGGGALSLDPIGALRREHAREIEAKLILSSSVGDWNVSENFVCEKNLSEAEGIEFGYSVGVSRGLGGLASGTACRFCRENFVVGAEAYGGLGSTKEATLAETRHFIAPVISWRVSPGMTIKASVGFGMTGASDRYLVRMGSAYEFPLTGAGR